MRYSFREIIEAFEDELKLWPPSEHSFEHILMDVKSQRLPDLRLAKDQKAELQRIYLEAKFNESAKK